MTGLAGWLRLYRLGQWPPGFYRDEAYNGLDALGVLSGTTLFSANNGREPLFIYLVALSVALFGPTVYAVRLPAAVVGRWRRGPPTSWAATGLAGSPACWPPSLWAVTFWPVHLGRGLAARRAARSVAGAGLWLGTQAYRRHRAGLWLVPGAV